MQICCNNKKKKPAKSNEFFKEGVFNYQSQVVNSSLLLRIKNLWKSTVYPMRLLFNFFPF